MRAYDPHRDLYQILGVEPTGESAEIRKARNQRLREAHPDHHPRKATAHRDTVEINQAWAVLRDPLQRAAYDALRTGYLEEEIPRSCAAVGHSRSVRTKSYGPLA